MNKNVVIIGGGIQGLEAACALCMNGKEAIIAEALEYCCRSGKNGSYKTLTDENPDAASYKRIFIRDNKIAGAILIGEAKYSTLLKNAVENKTDLSDIDLSNISVDELLSKLKSK